MAHMTKIGGTACEIGGGKVLVGGTGYSIDKGRTLVDGTGYDISFSLTVGSLPLGSSVFLTGSSYGTAVTREFIVVNQGIPQESDYYDETADGTWLLSKNALSKRAGGGNNVAFYQNSGVRNYLENTYYNAFDSKIRSIIKEVRIPYINNSGNGYLKYGSAGLPSKVFSLSAREVGLTSSIISGLRSEGARLDYFKSQETDTNRIAYYDGAAVNWWLRSPVEGGNLQLRYVTTSGGHGQGYNYVEHNVRPALVLPKETLLDDAHYIIA
jgi:hypothetical protein